MAKLRVKKDEINEEIYLIDFISDIEYVSKSGNFYKYLYDDIYLKRKPSKNNSNSYMYITLTTTERKQIHRRVHVILAKMFIENPNPREYTVVGHKDNIKWNNELSNLYWTSIQENTQKAVDDGLLVNKKAEENETSQPIAVYSVETNELVSVYGSISNCSVYIENSSKSYIHKVCFKDYKPRGKIYKYQACSKEFFEEHKDIANKYLKDSSINKDPTVFILTNNSGFKAIMDNQTQAEKITGIPQSKISHLVKNNGSYNGWDFKFLNKTTYKKSSVYTNFKQVCNSYLARNINTNEVKIFDSAFDMKEYFGIKGHDIAAYLNGGLLLAQWKIIQIDENSNLKIEVA